MALKALKAQLPHIRRLRRLRRTLPPIWRIGRLRRTLPPIWRIGRLGRTLPPIRRIGRLRRTLPPIRRIGRLGRTLPPEVQRSNQAADRDLIVDSRRAIAGLRPSFSAHVSGFPARAPPIPACAAFIKESRMKLASARKLYRKSGVRWCERGAPVRFPPSSLRDGLLQNSCVHRRVIRR
jgi:hypothetical protein